MSRHVTYRVLAIGSTDAAGKAKQTARAEGLRVQTLCRVSLAEDVAQPADTRREAAAWIVELAVRS